MWLFASLMNIAKSLLVGRDMESPVVCAGQGS